MQTIRTPQTATAFLAVLCETGSVDKACDGARIARNSAYLWRRDDEDFRAKWDAARATAGELLECEAYRRAVDGVDKPVYQGGELVGVVREYSDTLLTTLLKANLPDKFRENTRVEHAGGIDLSGASDAELEAKLRKFGVL
jgi:hypothetical protein